MNYAFNLESDEEFLSEFEGKEVTIPDTITDNGTDITNGIMDQVIFGNIKNNSCKCGNYSGIIYRNMTCPKCNVTVTNKSVRKTIFGYFKLPIKIPIPLFKDVILNKILFINKKDYLKLYSPTEVYFKPTTKGKVVLDIDGDSIRGSIVFVPEGIKLGKGILSLPKIFELYNSQLSTQNAFKHMQIPSICRLYII
jgi:DNA-directed RNA polymerase beta' subunit